MKNPYLDRLVGVFRSKKQFETVKRSASGFTGSNNGRLFADFNPASTSMDSLLRTELRVLRNRSRWCLANISWVAHYQTMMMNNVVGSHPRGFQFQNRAYLDKKTTSNESKVDVLSNSEIESQWNDFTNSTNLCVNGKWSMRDVLRLAVTGLICDGEFILRIHTGARIGGRKSKYGIQIEVIEPDYLDEMYNEVMPNGNIVIMGVEMNKFGRPIKYWFREKLPNATFGVTPGQSGERYSVNADEIIHVFDPKRAYQTRGIPLLAPILFSLRMLQGFDENTLVSARVGASSMGFIVTENGVENKWVGDSVDEYGNQITDAEPGQIRTLNPGQKFEAFNPNNPNNLYDPFTRTVLRGIAAGLSVSYANFANDLADVNFSSMRSGMVEERDYYRSLQVLIVEHVLIPLYDQWFDMALLSGQLSFSIAEVARLKKPFFIGRTWDYVDPEKDANANKIELESGQTTQTEVLSKRGIDFNDWLAQRKFEQDAIKEAGILLGSPDKNEQGKRNDTTANKTGN